VTRASAGSVEASVLLEPGCNLACPVCDCRLAPAARRESDGLPREFGRGGGVLELRGEASAQKDLARAVTRAREGGWSTIRVRTNGTAFATPERAAALRRLGVDGVVFFLASDKPAIHDAIARVRGAHAAGLRGLSALAGEGLDVTLEIPVLDPSLQDLRAALALALRAAPRARALRLYSPAALRPVDGKAPKELVAPRWDRVRQALLATVALAREAGLAMALSERDGIPLCALAQDESSIPEAIFADRGSRPVPRRETSSLGPACASCSAASVCPGTTRRYLDTHGDKGLVPFPRAPKGLRRAGARWDEERKSAAQRAFFVVLRPTVHCNQDCWFCSANETSQNVEADPGRMMRRIARLARTGAQQVSFSGGEPTLSRHLVDYVEVARRSGIERVELVSNAVLLDRPEKVEALVRAGLTHLFVSLHAHDEALSRLETRKVGDHARTVRALHLFARHEHVRIDVNHVVSAHNHRSLVRFIEWLHDEFGTRIGVSFAWVTPQYRALEHVGRLVPRYAEAMPFLKRAIARAVELGIDVVVGSRQGVPPCQLDELLPWSDVLSAVSGALAEDKPQKQKDLACERCRLDLVCTGVWKPYAALHGTGELRPLPGDKISPEEATRQAERVRFEIEGGYPTALRFGDGRIPRSADIPLPDRATHRRLPVLPPDDDRIVRDRRTSDRSVSLGRTIRVALVGSGPRAMAFARAISRASGLSLAAVASPHAPDKDLPEIGPAVARIRDLDALPADVEALVIASSTGTHAEVARMALARGMVCLVEKPLASSLPEAEALAAEGGERVIVANQLRAAGGVAEIVGEMGDRTGAHRPIDIAITHRAAPSSSASLHAWARGPLYELLLHLGDLGLFFAGVPLAVRRAEAWGGGRPERICVKARGEGPLAPSASIDLVLDAPADGLLVEVRLEGGRRIGWTREPGRDEVRIADAFGERTRSAPSGGDLDRLVAAFHASLAHAATPPATAADGVRAMRFAGEVLRALEASGAPFARATEPKRVASFALRDRFG
jgi:MoaA/NifB/PqqE/SkfB family radical SAM enzyme/predicted dehydrogenase